MSNRWRSLARHAAVGVLALAAGAGCDSRSDGSQPAPSAPAQALAPSPTSTAADVANPPDEPLPAITKAPAAPAWPSPEDCVSYDPAALTVRYEAGVYAVTDGSTVVLRLRGGPGDNVGDKGLALAQRFGKHCFLGRDNTREDKNSYIFDYWRDPSGMDPAIADQEEDCSSYDRTNLTVEDMGGGHGWRVKDHDHVLHVFDDESDARDGKLVASKYGQICYIRSSEDVDAPEVVTYFL